MDEHAEWEIALASGAGALQPTPHHRPELMLTYFVIDRASDFIHHGFPLPSSTALDELQPQIVGVLLRLGFSPGRMLVPPGGRRSDRGPEGAHDPSGLGPRRFHCFRDAFASSIERNLNTPRGRSRG